MRQRTLWILVAVILGVVLGMFALSTTEQERESPEDETGLLYQVMVALGITRRRKR